MWESLAKTAHTPSTLLNSHPVAEVAAAGVPLGGEEGGSGAAGKRKADDLSGGAAVEAPKRLAVDAAAVV